MRIIEILGRSDQGMTRPFLCRAEDGELYYVKGNFAGYYALCAEWCAGKLAFFCDLPVAPFAIVEIPQTLIRGSLRDDIHELGSGEAFGSQRVEDADELRWSQVEERQISDDLRARLLIFDWWVMNPDRILTKLGGNPNLLWSSSKSQLHVIDHNLAFSEKMPATFSEFAADHVFGPDLVAQEIKAIEVDAQKYAPIYGACGELRSSWQKHNNVLSEIWNEIPEMWLDTAPDFTQNKLRESLNRVLEDDFAVVEE